MFSEINDKWQQKNNLYIKKVQLINIKISYIGSISKS